MPSYNEMAKEKQRLITWVCIRVTELLISELPVVQQLPWSVIVVPEINPNLTILPANAGGYSLLWALLHLHNNSSFTSYILMMKPKQIFNQVLLMTLSWQGAEHDGTSTWWPCCSLQIQFHNKINTVTFVTSTGIIPKVSTVLGQGLNYDCLNELTKCLMGSIAMSYCDWSVAIPTTKSTLGNPSINLLWIFLTVWQIFLVGSSSK